MYALSKNASVCIILIKKKKQKHATPQHPLLMVLSVAFLGYVNIFQLSLFDKA